jgi:hypothetical protein
MFSKDLQSFLGAFAKSLKATISTVVSVSLFASTHGTIQTSLYGFSWKFLSETLSNNQQMRR